MFINVSLSGKQNDVLLQCNHKTGKGFRTPFGTYSWPQERLHTGFHVSVWMIPLDPNKLSWKQGLGMFSLHFDLKCESIAL
jgi:hypothetical protein